jgi:hypothetical protein
MCEESSLGEQKAASALEGREDAFTMQIRRH